MVGRARLGLEKDTDLSREGVGCGLKEIRCVVVQIEILGVRQDGFGPLRVVTGPYLDPQHQTIERFGLGDAFDDRAALWDQLWLPFSPPPAPLGGGRGAADREWT